MERKAPTMGGSLLVPCVKELAAKEPLTTLPPRYLRPDQEPSITSSDEFNSLLQVPVINLQRLLSEDSKNSELEKLHKACKEWGFFQLINHEVNSSLVEKVKLEIQDFFNLPMEEKKKYWQQPGDIEGFGQAFVVSEEQKLDWGDLFYMVTLPENLRKPHLFPKLPTPFRDTLELYSAELKNLAKEILNLMAKALRMDAKDMTELFEEGMQQMRMNYYPPCPQPELAMGLTPHTDGTGLTILLQVNEIEGLQIVTNGTYCSIEHRATVNAMKERLSIATFYSPKLDRDLGPAPSLITPETPALFRRSSVEEYFRGYLSRELRGKSYEDSKLRKVGRFE